MEFTVDQKIKYGITILLISFVYGRTVSNNIP